VIKSTKFLELIDGHREGIFFRKHCYCETPDNCSNSKQALHHGAVFCVNHPIGGVHDELTTTRFALVILLAVVDMAVFLEQL